MFSQDQPSRQLRKRHTFVPLLQDTLQAFQNPLCNPESLQFNNIAYTLKNCEFFRNHLPKHIDLNKFAELAKQHVNYETHEAGSMLHYEKDEVNKFFIILDGSAVKMRSKTMSTDFDISPSKLSLNINNPRSNPENLYANTLTKLFLGTEREIPEPLPIVNTPSPRSSVGYFLNPRLMVPLQQTEGQSTGPQTPKSASGGQHPQQQNRHFSIDIGASQKGGRSSIIIDEIESEQESHKGPNSARKVIQKIFNPPNYITKTRGSVRLNISEAQEMSEKLSPSKLRNQRKSGFGPSLLKIEDDISEIQCSQTPQTIEIKSFRHLDKKISASPVKLRNYEAGDFFGEAFCSQHKQKENCMIVTSSEVLHALTLDRESYFKILKELNAEKHNKIDVFLNLFPAFDLCLVEEFSTFFIQKTFHNDEVIYSQSEPSQYFYLIKAGQVKLLRDFHASNTEPTSPSSANLASNKKEISVVSIVKNQVFGDEVLVSKPLRQYTAVSNSPKTTVFMMDFSTIEKIKFKFGKMFEVLKAQAQEKLAWRSQKALEIFDTQFGSRHASNLLTYTPKSCNAAKTGKSSLSWADVSLPQKTKPVFHASSYQQFVEKSPVFPKIESKKEEESSNEDQGERLEKYKNAFSRAYIAPKLTVLQNHRKAASFKSINNLVVKMNDPFEFNIRKELYGSGKKSSQTESSASPTDKKYQRASTKSKTMLSVKNTSPKIIITPVQSKTPTTTSIGILSVFKEKLPQLIQKSPKSPKNFNLNFAQLHQEKLDVLNGLSISNRSKSAQKVLAELIKV